MLTEIREAMASALSSISGLQASAVVLTNPSLPTAYVVPGNIDYHRAMGTAELTDWNMIVELQVATVSDAGAQKKLDAYLDGTGALSVKAALESDRTLGGVVSDVVVQGVRDYGMFARAQGDTVLGARIQVLVLT